MNWEVCQQLGPPNSGLYSSLKAVDTYVHVCIHISMCICIMCMYEYTHPHTSSGALPAQTTESFKKKAFKRIIWWIPLYLDKNIPHSKKMTSLPFPKISSLCKRGLQPPINDVLDFLKTLMMEKFLFATLKNCTPACIPNSSYHTILTLPRTYHLLTTA